MDILNHIQFRKYRRGILFGLFAFFWMTSHLVGTFFGVHQLPLHQSYIGDEQAPVNGALHVLQEKSLLGLRNLRTVYYGPVFSLLAIPAVLADFGRRALFDGVRSAEDYKDFILWDWGGIVLWLRVTAVLVSLVGLFYVYKILMTQTCNPSKNTKWAFIGTSLVALNYYYFEYSHFFKHWIFVLVILLAQIYLIIRIYETRGERLQQWIWHGVLGVISFGISYISMAFYVAFVPTAFYIWRLGKDLKIRLFKYILWVGAGGFLVILWHPYALYRYLGFLGIGNVQNGIGNAQNPFATSASSWTYYLTEIFLNHAPLLVAFAVLLALTLHRRINIINDVKLWPWMFGSVALLNILIFAPAEHHEGRYMLPSILMLLLATAILLIRHIASTHKKTATNIICIFLLLYGLYHILHIGRWMYVYAQDPAEKVMISDALKLQEETNASIGVAQSYIVGHVHTKEAYHA